MEFHGKDSCPFDTIEKCSSYLLKNKILVREFWHPNKIGVYSVTLSIDNCLLFSNGKGINKEYALASAYGELFERLLNGAYSRINSQSYYELHNKKSKKRDDDLFKKWCDLSNVEYKNVQLITNQLNTDYDRYYEIWNNIEDKKDKLVLSNRFTDLWYGTNGMCFGNTYYEAIVQGLSEILERFVVYSIENQNGIIMENFDIKKLHNNNLIDKYINLLNRENIEVKCIKFRSTIDLPVLGVIFFDNLTRNSTLRVGAHPISEIAIERCFTEFLQGKSSPRIYDFSKKVNENSNQYFLDGNYKIKSLSLSTNNQMSKKYNDILSNKSAFEYLLVLFNYFNKKIYIIDNSINNFLKAYKIIVPGLSEVWGLNLPYSKFKYLEIFCENINNKKNLLTEQILAITRDFNIKHTDSVKNLFELKFTIDGNTYNGKFYQYICCYLYQTNQLIELNKYIECIKFEISNSELMLIKNLSMINSVEEFLKNCDMDFYLMEHEFYIQFRMNDSIISKRRNKLELRRIEFNENV